MVTQSVAVGQSKSFFKKKFSPLFKKKNCGHLKHVMSTLQIYKFRSYDCKITYTSSSVSEVFRFSFKND